MKQFPFQVASRLVQDVAIVYPKGYLNNLAGEGLVTECGNFARAGIRKVIVNFRETDLINSIGISFLLQMMEELQAVGGTLCFTEMSKSHVDIFEMLGLTKYFVVFGDETEALRFLEGREG